MYYNKGEEKKNREFCFGLQKFIGVVLQGSRSAESFGMERPVSERVCVGAAGQDKK